MPVSLPRMRRNTLDSSLKTGLHLIIYASLTRICWKKWESLLSVTLLPSFNALRPSILRLVHIYLDIVFCRSFQRQTIWRLSPQLLHWLRNLLFHLVMKCRCPPSAVYLNKLKVLTKLSCPKEKPKKPEQFFGKWASVSWICVLICLEKCFDGCFLSLRCTWYADFNSNCCNNRSALFNNAKYYACG